MGPHGNPQGLALADEDAFGLVDAPDQSEVAVELFVVVVTLGLGRHLGWVCFTLVAK